MNKSCVIVVEGKSDEAFIKSFLDIDVVTTNGSEVSRETIDFIKALSKDKKIIVLTDPDSPGKRIRDVLDKEIPGLLHAYLPKERCIKKGKVGVAESDKETVLGAINNLIPANSQDSKSDVTTSSLVDLGLVGRDDSSKRRKIIEEKFHLGHTNGKTILKRIKAMDIMYKDLEDALNGRK